METAIIVGAVAAATSAAMAGAAASSQASAQSKAAQYNADALHQQGITAVNTAASNATIQQRRGAADLGEQAAAFGEANIGTGGSVAQVEKQSAATSELDRLNILYGGELEKHQADTAANLERYQSLSYKRESDNALIGGAVNSGTALLSGGMKYGVYKKYGLGGLASINTGFGTS